MMKSTPSEFAVMCDVALAVQKELLNISWERFKEYNKKTNRLTNLPITGCNISFNVTRNIRFEIGDEYFYIYFVKPYEGVSSWVKLYTFRPERGSSSFYNSKYNQVVEKQLNSILTFIIEAKEQIAKEDKEEREEIEQEMDKILLGGSE